MWLCLATDVAVLLLVILCLSLLGVLSHVGCIGLFFFLAYALYNFVDFGLFFFFELVIVWL